MEFYKVKGQEDYQDAQTRMHCLCCLKNLGYAQAPTCHGQWFKHNLGSTMIP